MDIVRRASSADITCVQNAYSLVDREFEDVFRFCAETNVAWVPLFPLGGAVPGMPKVIEQPQVIAVANRLGATPSQIGLAWLLQQSANTLLIPGTSNVSHLEENCAAGSVTLDQEAIRELDTIKLSH
ncbi:aldo/keto reductase [Shinella sp. HY16]|nr:aldo/keto reductase [Shinella sp. YE25]MDC7266847.1 aldo/keto reductase [Shinella sp. HY16]MDC7273744.1 aldo/keto reductase [Shinella sp. YZ44]CAK7261902.1 protein of unknown function [Shinella sp. WSC3-e]